MATTSHPVMAGANGIHHRATLGGRGRGRGRGRKSPDSDSADNTHTTDFAVDSSDALSVRRTELSHSRHGVSQGQFEDPDYSRPRETRPHRLIHNHNANSPPKHGQLEDYYSGRRTETKSHRLIHSHNGTPEKDAACQASNNRNSGSPKTVRSRRSMFDTGIMSQINSHLRKGINEQSTPTDQTRSLDRLPKESPMTRPSRDITSVARAQSPLLATPLKIQIPGSRVASSGPMHRHVVVEGRPRSHTDPLTPEKAAADLRLTNDSAGLLCVGAGQTDGDPQRSVPSPPLSATKVRGRGRARGRCRSKHSDSAPAAAPPRPGGASESTFSQRRQSDPGAPPKMTEQFSDAADHVAKFKGTVNDSASRDTDKAAGSRGAVNNSANRDTDKAAGFKGTANHSASRDTDKAAGFKGTVNHSASGVTTEKVAGECGPGPVAGGDPCSRAEKAEGGSPREGSPHTDSGVTSRHGHHHHHANGKGLKLKIAADPDPQVTMDDLDPRSPDDMDLLSPNHEFVTDWAAAMMTPPAESSSMTSPHLPTVWENNDY